MKQKVLTIGQTAKMLAVSIQTLRRWDKENRLTAVRKKPSGHRYYRLEDVEQFLIQSADHFYLAKQWVAGQAKEPEHQFYFPTALEFKIQLALLEKRLGEITELHEWYSLIVAVVGEIGNNSFDHNWGNWPDVSGIFFGFNIEKKEIVLADRGHGILQTLRKVKQTLTNDKEALEVAFTEIISGRAPEARGNGLKFVRKVITRNPMTLFFQSGDAQLIIKQNDTKLRINTAETYLRGCLAKITF